ARLIDDGQLARHVRRMQRLYGARRALLLERLRRDFAGQLEPLPSVAGLHVAARLLDHAETDAIARARAAGVGLGALAPCYAGDRRQPGVLLGFGNVDERRIGEGLRRLRTAW
ncbi:MAG: PLP-dependent aminotransferase family protein, partial [Proteobacteria bacterium]|nr:PLP-dependent aminotransferase family protein [Pseudomonadota bacterium]